MNIESIDISGFIVTFWDCYAEAFGIYIAVGLGVQVLVYILHHMNKIK